MDTRPQQEEGRIAISAPLRVLQWWGKHPWDVFWGSLVLSMLFYLLAALLAELHAVGGWIGEWITAVGIPVLILGGMVSYGWGVVSGLLDKRTLMWKRTLRGLALTVIPVLFAAIAVPELLTAQRKGKVGRTLHDTQQAVTQAIEYGRAKGRYPTSLQVLREMGYSSTPDQDPWGRDYVLAPILTQGSTPTAGDDVYVYSKGARGTGSYPPSLTADLEEWGSVGYSSIYRGWYDR